MPPKREPKKIGPGPLAGMRTGGPTDPVYDPAHVPGRWAGMRHGGPADEQAIHAAIVREQYERLGLDPMTGKPKKKE